MTSYSYAPDPTPDATYIAAGGLNNAGNFVGFTGNYQSDAKGFLYANGSFTGLNYPGAAATTPADLNDSGQVVGSYRLAGSTNTSHGFVYDGTTFAPIDMPGGHFTEAYGISNAGTIVGDYIDASNQFRGFVYQAGQYTSLDVPGASATFATGVNDLGQVVGSYDRATGADTTETDGFLYANGSFQTIRYPGATTTTLNGISNTGRIIGSAYTQTTDANGFVTTTNLRSFTYQNGTFEDLAPPTGAQDVPPTLTGINDQNQLLEIVTDEQSGRTRIVTATPVCFVAGTLIRTSRGEVPIEALRVGDLAVTADGEHRPIRWIGHRRLDACQRPGNTPIELVRITANALGPDRPVRDLVVTPAHAIALDLLGEVLIPARCLVNGASITREHVDSVTVWHVELDSHDLILAENQPAESFLDMGNRRGFAESAVVYLHGALASDPDGDPASRTHADFCRPYHDGGVILAAVRAQLRRRALALGWRLAQAAPFAGVRLEVDGTIVLPQVRGTSARFVLPADAREVWLVSPVSVPHNVGDSPDGRALGLYLRGLTLDEGWGAPRAIALDDPLLDEGFHEVEPGRRWTAGRAALPSALLAGLEGPVSLRLDLDAQARLPRWIAPAADAEAIAA